MLIDDKKAALSTLTGMTSSIPDMELKWLQTSTGSSEFSIPQLWYIYLTTLGYSGSIPDMKVKYFQSLGYSGALPEMEAAFWAAGGAPSWGATMDRWWDFTRNIGGVPTTITDIHAQSHLADNVAGVYSSFAADVLVRTNKGIQTSPTRTNQIKNPSAAGASGGAFPTGWSAGSTNFTSVTRTITQTTRNGLSGVAIRYQIVASGAGQTLFERFGGTADVAIPASTAHVMSCFTEVIAGDATNIKTYLNVPQFDVSSVLTGEVFSTPIALATTWTRHIYAWTTPASTVKAEPRIRFDVTAAGTYDFTVFVARPQLEAGVFAGPPIADASATTTDTTNGNLQSIDLTGKLALGVRGIIRVDIRDVTTTYKSIFMLNPGSIATDYITLYANEGGSRCVLYSVAGGVVQAGIVLPTALTVGVNTFAFAASANYVMCRRVGDTAPSADTSGTLPSMSRFGIGGSGVNTSNNIYQITKQLALDFGPQDATTFADVYAKAQILDALP